MTYHTVIVGSGFGGAVTACRLAAAGDKVLVLERGRCWHPNTYPREACDPWVWDQARPEAHNGWIDMRFLDQMWVVQGAGVGGGSLIYANICVDAKPSSFHSGWPSQITFDELRPHYDVVADMLGADAIPDAQETPRLRLMREGADKTGAPERFRKVPLAVTFDDTWSAPAGHYRPPPATAPKQNRFGKTQGTCTHCGTCDIGCQVQAKNTLDLNYLASAEASGAHIQPLSMVSHVAPAKEGWVVHYDRLENGRRIPERVEAKRVILAAGSLGSTEVLLRSRDQYRSLPALSRALGYGWSSNGDFLTPAFYGAGREPISPSIGPTITCAIDYLDGDANGARYFVEDGGFPNVLGQFARARLKRFGIGGEHRFLRHVSKALFGDPMRNMMPWFGQAVDAANGRLYLDRPWYAPWRRQLYLDCRDPARSEKAVNALINMHVALSKATGGVPEVPLTWTVLRNLVTPHPLGGCNMAASPATGVVDHRGEVFGYKDLYVADGSIVPRAIGLNPSKTIAALAERISQLILNRAPAAG